MHDPKSVCHIRKQGKVVFKCFQRKTTYPTKKEKLSAKISKGRLF